MDKPLDEKALKIAADQIRSALGRCTYEEIAGKVLEHLAKNGFVLISSSTQVGESEAGDFEFVGWQRGFGESDSWMDSLTRDKEQEVLWKSWGHPVRALYTAPPSFTAVQAENERLREALVTIRDKKHQCNRAVDCQHVARFALAGQEKQE